VKLIGALIVCFIACALVFGIGYGAHAAWDWLRGKSL
jgi:hypothetical protein